MSPPRRSARSWRRPATRRPCARCRSRVDGGLRALPRALPERLEQLDVHRVLDRVLEAGRPLAVAAPYVNGAVAAAVEWGEVGHPLIEAKPSGQPTYMDRESATPEDLPPLELRKLRDLEVREPAGPGGRRT